MSTNTNDKCSCARLRPNKKDKVVIIVLQHDCVFIIIRVSAIPDECPDAALCPTSYHGEIIYGGTRWIEYDCSATFSEYIFLFPACLMISHWLTKNAELNSVF